MFSSDNLPRALARIDHELEQKALEYLKEFGQAFPHASKVIFPASEMVSKSSDYRNNKTIEFDSQISVMYHQCLPKGEDGLYRGRAHLMNTKGDKMMMNCHFIHEDEQSATHKHDFIEFIYVRSGYLTEIIEGKKHVFHEHQVCFLNRSCEHRDIRSESVCSSFFIGIRPGVLNDFMMRSLENSGVRNFLLDSMRNKQQSSYLSLTLDDEEAAHIDSYLGEIICELFDAEDGYTQLCQVLLLRMLNTMGKSKDNELISIQSDSRDKLMYNVLIDFIVQNLPIVDLELLCSQFHYQKDYFNRLIRKHTGLTFSALLQKLRLDRAKDMLAGTDLPASDISSLVGYNNPTYFFRLFKEETGLTPQEYRIGKHTALSSES